MSSQFSVVAFEKAIELTLAFSVIGLRAGGLKL
jgi:hypothetical protein